MLALSFLLPLVLRVSQASATALPRDLNAIAPLFTARQSSGLDPSTLPTQCQAICTPIANTLNTCSSITCLCTTANANSLATCVDCIVGVDPSSTEIANGQTILTEYVAACDAGGAPVPSETVNVGAATTVATTTPSGPIATTATATAGHVTSVTVIAPTKSTVTFVSPTNTPTTTGSGSGGSGSGSNPIGGLTGSAGRVNVGMAWVAIVGGAVLGLGALGI